MSVRNPGDVSVEVARIESSCDCIRATPATFRVAPHGSSSFSVAFEPAKDENFQGELSVSLTGYDPDGTVVFRSKVDLEVGPPSADPGHAASSRSPSSAASTPSSRPETAVSGGSQHGAR